MRKLTLVICLGLFTCLPLVSALAADQDAVDACVRAIKAQKPQQKHIGADYQPGVDVYGRKVAPADLDGGYDVQLPDVIEFPIQYDAAQNLGFNADGLFEGKATVATVRIEGNKVSINGQEVYTTGAADLIAECRRQSE